MRVRLAVTTLRIFCTSINRCQYLVRVALVLPLGRNITEPARASFFVSRFCYPILSDFYLRRVSVRCSAARFVFCYYSIHSLSLVRTTQYSVSAVLFLHRSTKYQHPSLLQFCRAPGGKKVARGIGLICKLYQSAVSGCMNQYDTPH